MNCKKILMWIALAILLCIPIIATLIVCLVLFIIWFICEQIRWLFTSICEDIINYLFRAWGLDLRTEKKEFCTLKSKYGDDITNEYTKKLYKEEKWDIY